MPKKAAVDIATIFDAVKHYPIFDEATGLLKTETAPVWKHIKKENEERLKNIKIHNLQGKIFYNTKNIQADLRCYQRVKIPITKEKKKRIKTSNYLSNETLQELLRIKFSEKYSNVLHQVTSYPFSIFFWFPEQKNLAKELMKYTDYSMCFFLVHNIVEKVTIGERKSDSLFLGIVCITFENKMWPLYQTISEEANAEPFIKKFLREILKDLLTEPTNMSVPFSFEHANCVSLVFNKMKLEKYIEKVFLVFRNDLSSAHVSTFIHVDFTQLLIVLNNCQFDTEAAKKFFIHLLIYLSTVTDIQSFDTDVIDIFILFQSRLETDKIKRIKQKFLSKFSAAIRNVYVSFLDVLKNYEEKFSFLNNVQLSQWEIPGRNELHFHIEDLKNQALMAIDDTQDFHNLNGYFSYDLTCHFFNLLKIYPLWAQTDASSDSINFAINHVEEHFNSTFKLPVIDFLDKHLNIIESLTGQGLQFVDKLKHKRLPRESTNTSYHSYLFQQENWMGKNFYENSALHEEVSLNDNDVSLFRNDQFIGNEDNTKESSPEKSAEFDPSFTYDDFDYSDKYHEASHSTPIKKKLKRSLSPNNGLLMEHSPVSLKNRRMHHNEGENIIPATNSQNQKQPRSGQQGGYVSRFPAFKATHALKTKTRVKTEVQIRSGCKLGTRQINSTKFKIRESSVFDSLAELFHFMCKNIKGFDSYCESSKCADLKTCFFSAIWALYKSGQVQTMYKHRADILYACGEVGEVFIDINETPGNFLSTLLREGSRNLHFAFRQTKLCTVCGYQNEISVVTLEVNCQQLSDLETILKSFFLNIACEKCLNNSLLVDYDLKRFLAIDVESNNIDSFLNTIPNCLNFIGEKKYLLSGVLSVKSFKNTESKHYTAFCRLPDDRWFKRDNSDKPTTNALKSYPRITVAMIFYILTDI